LTALTRLAAAAALLLASACSGGPEILEPDPTATSDPSAVESPVMPKQASESSDEGAAAAAFHWIQLFNYASKTGDVEGLQRYSKSCNACLEYSETIASLSKDERPDSDPWQVKSTVVSRDEEASDVRFSVEIPGGTVEDVAFEMSPKAPYRIRDIYTVEDGK
jgi:hypothetical protein